MGSCNTLFTTSKSIHKESKVVILAAGTGRAAMDIASVTDFLHITVNDLSLANLKKAHGFIHQNLKEKHEENSDLPSSKERLALKRGDAIALLRKLDPNSVDLLHSANFIHFLNPEQLEQYFTEVGRVLKPGGKCYTFWQTHDNGLPPITHSFMFSNPLESVESIVSKLSDSTTKIVAKKYRHLRATLLKNFTATVEAREVPKNSKESNGAVFVFQKN